MSRVEIRPLATRPAQRSAENKATTDDTPLPSGSLASDQIALSSTGVKDARGFGRFLENQNKNGVTNGCGTTSLAMTLSFWTGTPGAYTRERIDNTIRRFNLASSPQNIVDYAESQGFRASAMNNANLEDLRAFLDKGVPVQVMYDPDGDGSDATLHYVVVTDYESNEKGALTALKIADPWGGIEAVVPVDTFNERWDQLGLYGRSTGINNLMIPLLPESNVPIRGKDGVIRDADDISLPAKSNLDWRVGVADKLFDAANALDQVNDAAKATFKKLWPFS